MPNGNGQGKAPTSPTGLPALPKSGDFVPPEPSTAQRIIRALTLLSASQTGQPNLALSMFNQFRQQDALNQRAAQQKFDNAFERARLLRQNALTQEQIRVIAQIQLRGLESRLKDKDMSMEVSEAALDELGKTGFDPVYGARPLKRQIQQVIENPVAMAILAGEIGAGEAINIDVNSSGEFIFNH